MNVTIEPPRPLRPVVPAVAARPAATATASEAPPAATPAPARVLTPEATRALAEAEERRRQRAAEAESRPAELGGREGPDPARYGDWEKNGIASDF